MRFIIFFTLFLLSGLAFAADPATPDISIVNTVNEAIKLASTSIMPQALKWLGAFMGLQFVVTNINIIKSDGDLAAFTAKLLGTLLWFMFCFYVIQNGPDFINSVGNGVLTKFAPNLPSPGSIIAATLGICTSIFIGVVATGTSIAGIGNSSIAMTLVYICFFIFAIGSFMAIKLIMLQLELGLMVMMAPLNFSFLGLTALRDQGIAPFKSLMSLIFRIILLGVVFTAFSKVVETTGVQLDSYSWKNPFDWPSKVELIFSALFAFPVCAYLVWKSDSIAASLASGSTNMGTGDVASAAAAGAALGAAAGAGGATAVETAGKAGQSMSDVIKNLNAGISNDSPSGAGGAGGIDQKPVGDVPPPPPKEAEMSLQEMRDHPSAIGNQEGGGGGDSPTSSETTNSESTGETPSNSSQMDSDSSGATKAANTIDNLASSGKLKDADTAKHVSDHLKSMDPSPSDAKAAGGVPSKAVSSGSGESAGIGGSTSATDQKLDKLIDSMSQPKKATFGDRLSTANDHIAKEQAATTVSISTHHSD